MNKILLIVMIFTSSILYSQGQFDGGISFISENDNAEGENGFNVFIDYPIDNSKFIRASIGKFNSDVILDDLPKSDYSQLWVEGSLLLKGNKEKIQTSFGGGIGYYNFNHKLSTNIESLFYDEGLRVKEKIEDMIGFHLRGGANTELSPTLQLNTDIKYAFLEPKVEVRVTDLSTFESLNVSEKIELNTLTISVGIIINI